MFGFDHPFYRPLWIRVIVVVVPAVWGVFEFVSGAALWGALFCGAAVLAFHGLFINFDPNNPDGTKPAGKPSDKKEE